MLTGHLSSLENDYLGLLPIFKNWLNVWILSCMNCLYSLDINPLVCHIICKFFSHSIGCFFFCCCCWLIVFFAMQKLLGLIKSHLFIFAFISFPLGKWGKKILLLFTSKNILPLFSSRSFMLSCLKCRSFNYFESIFVYGMRECSNFIDLLVAVQLSQHYLLKRHFYLLCILASFVIN